MWNVNDDESDICSQDGCDAMTITQDATGAELTCEATSGGGLNSESVTIRRDATPPVLTAIHSDISDGGQYAEQPVPDEPTCEAADDVSGIDECQVSGYSSAVGSHTITFTAIDNAGNESPPEILSYDVVVS
jgi:HYR domain